MQMMLRALVSAVNVSKETGKFYVEFLFVGGSISLQVDSEQGNKLKALEGQENDFLFLARPRQISFYGRPLCVFEIVKFQQILVKK